MPVRACPLAADMGLIVSICTLERSLQELADYCSNELFCLVLAESLRLSTSLDRKARTSMKTTKQNMPVPSPVWDDEPTPDVWWGANGIDAPLWADPRPYAGQSVDASTEAAVTVLAGDAR